jgi:hypothetical protein
MPATFAFVAAFVMPRTQLKAERDAKPIPCWDGNTAAHIVKDRRRHLDGESILLNRLRR